MLPMHPRLRSVIAIVLAVALAATVAFSTLSVVVWEPGREDPDAPAETETPPPEDGVSAADIYSLAGGFQGCLFPEEPVDPPDDDEDEGAGPAARLPGVSEGVEQLRNLEFDRDVPAEFLDKEEFTELAMRRVQRSMKAEDLATLTDILVMLDAVPSDLDLEQATNELLGQSITGLYMPSREKLFVATTEGELDPSSEVTLAHELGHAIVDQQVGLPKLGALGRSDADAGFAAQALVEGDATLLSQQYAISLMTQDEIQDLYGDVEGQAESLTAEIPYILEQTFFFPYREGAMFVCHLFAEGGWDAVNDAYGDLPQASADILFPHRYETGIEPGDPADPEPPGGAWERVERSTLGATDLLWLMQAAAAGGAPVASDGVDRVMGWNGGEIFAYRHARTDELALYIGLVDGGVDVAPEGFDPQSLESVILDWARSQLPQPKFYEWSPGEWSIWRRAGNFYVLAVTGEGVSLAVAGDYGTARRLSMHAKEELPRRADVVRS